MSYNKEYASEYYQKNKELIKEKRLKYYAEHPEKRKAYALRDRTLLQRKLTERRNRLIDEQKGFCPCGDLLLTGEEEAHSRGVPITGKSTVLDHDHECCDVRPRNSCGNCDRAAMHSLCNQIIGMVNYSSERLRALADYIDFVKSNEIS